MTDNTHLVTSPLSQELYSIDWAVRFDEFRKHDQSSFTDIHQLLAKIEGLVESEISNDLGDLNDTKILTTLYNKSKPGSAQWHRLSMLIHLKIILAAIPKGLTATATLSAIEIMESVWKLADLKENISAKPEKKSSQSKPNKPAAKKPVIKAVQQPPARKKPKTSEAPGPAVKKAPSKTAVSKNSAKSSHNKRADDKTENVVIKKLAAEAGLDDDKVLEAKCYEIACSLAEEYPEYTLTAIRVMTAEKLGVTRQFVENLDIKPARFENG